MTSLGATLDDVEASTPSPHNSPTSRSPAYLPTTPEDMPSPPRGNGSSNHSSVGNAGSQSFSSARRLYRGRRLGPIVPPTPLILPPVERRRWSPASSPRSPPSTPPQREDWPEGAPPAMTNARTQTLRKMSSLQDAWRRSRSRSRSQSPPQREELTQAEWQTIVVQRQKQRSPSYQGPVLREWEAEQCDVSDAFLTWEAAIVLCEFELAAAEEGAQTAPTAHIVPRRSS